MLFMLFILALLFSFQSLFCRYYSSSRDGEGAVHFSVLYAVFVGVSTLAVNRFSYAPSAITVLLGLVNAMILLTYNIAMVRCSNLGSYAFMMVCSLSGGILVPMVYDALYLGYVFSPLQLVAIALILVAFVLMNLEGFSAKKNARYLLWCAILFVANGLYGVLMNLQQTLMNFTLRNEMIITTFLGMALMTSAFQLLVARKDFLRGFHMSRPSWLYLLLSALSATLAVNLMMVLMKSVNITLLSVMDNGGVLVLSALYAFTLFKEKPKPSALLGLLLVGAGVIMLSI